MTILITCDTLSRDFNHRWRLEGGSGKRQCTVGIQTSKCMTSMHFLFIMTILLFWCHFDVTIVENAHWLMAATPLVHYCVKKKDGSFLGPLKETKQKAKKGQQAKEIGTKSGCTTKVEAKVTARVQICTNNTPIENKRWHPPPEQEDAKETRQRNPSKVWSFFGDKSEILSTSYDVAECGFSGATVFPKLKLTWQWWKWFMFMKHYR